MIEEFIIENMSAIIILGMMVGTGLGVLFAFRSKAYRNMKKKESEYYRLRDELSQKK